MPYRRLHLVLPLLFPAILFAFWPGYFGQFASAPFGYHLHGIVATLWLMLLLAQGWSIHTRRAHLHRALGLALFVLVPLFVAGGLLLTQAMAGMGLANADPFHALFGVRLALVDLMSVVSFLALVAIAVARRRDPHRHAAAMTATVFLMLPPILGRMLPALPGFPRIEGMHPFALSFHIAQIAAALGAFLLSRSARGGAAMLCVVAFVIVAQSLMFETIGRMATWQAVTIALTTVPASLLAGAGILLAAAILAAAWVRTPQRGRGMATA